MFSEQVPTHNQWQVLHLLFLVVTCHQPLSSSVWHNSLASLGCQALSILTEDHHSCLKNYKLSYIKKGSLVAELLCTTLEPMARWKSSMILFGNQFNWHLNHSNFQWANGNMSWLMRSTWVNHCCVLPLMSFRTNVCSRTLSGPPLDLLCHLSCLMRTRCSWSSTCKPWNMILSWKRWSFSNATLRRPISVNRTAETQL